MDTNNKHMDEFILFATETLKRVEENAAKTIENSCASQKKMDNFVSSTKWVAGLMGAALIGTLINIYMLLSEKISREELNAVKTEMVSKNQALTMHNYNAENTKNVAYVLTSDADQREIIDKYTEQYKKWAETTFKLN